MDLNVLLHWIDVGVQVTAYAVSAASVITYASPTPKEGSKLAKVRKLLDVLALIPKAKK